MQNIPTSHDSIVPRLTTHVSGGWAMSETTVQIGHLVCSIQGRDSGRFYLVVEIEDGSRVRVADGEGRKVDNPKRKNVKHLKFYDVIAGEVTDKAQNGKRVTNADVRKELKSLVENL